MVLVLILGFLISYSVAESFQKSLSRPIAALAETAKSVSQTGNYSIRLENERVENSIAELNALSLEFNLMLDQIQAKDEKILAANTDLEKKVELRTTELREIQKTALTNAHAAGMAVTISTSSSKF